MEGKEPTSIAMETSNPSPPTNMNREPLDCKIRVATVVQDKGESEKNEIDEGRKKRKPIVWSYFTKLPLSETRGEHKAKCNHCRVIYSCDPIRHGTNSMNKHLHRSHKWIFNKVDKKATLHGYMPKINLEDCRRALAEFVICDEMPFKVVEGRGFRKLVNRLEPQFTVSSRFIIARDCCQLFLDERKKLKIWFMKSSMRVFLTTNCWTSNQNLSYMSLTSHFIDEEWKYQKRILNFSLIENHKGKTIGREIERCLREWGIDSVFTITIDNTGSNDVAVSYLQKKIDARGRLVCGGKYMHMRFCAHILNLVVSDGIKEQDSSVESIRNVVHYVRSSSQRFKRFKECVDEEMINSQSLVCLYVSTRWNSTYLMLERVVKFEKAFDRLYYRES